MSQDPDRRHSLAVIADAHFHDIEGDYGVAGIPVGTRRLTLQTWAHSRESTRVYNESAGALDRALQDVARRGIRHVVLLGDYTDDGQRRTTDSLARHLAAHERRFGTRFYALPGNHDVFGPWGRHQSRYFLQPDGPPVLVTSDGRDAPAQSAVSPLMYCEGYPAGLHPMARHGYFRRPEDLFWETPFGKDDAVEARTYEVVSPDTENRYRLMDASYLVEPEEGLWLLMIDANVFEPRDGRFAAGAKRAFIDSTAAGWNAMLRLKPFIFAWMGEVHARARALNKTLLTFSHYPAINPFGEEGAVYERALFPKGVIGKRMPQAAVAQAMVAAGIPLHFSGHWHVDGVSRYRDDSGMVTNVAVPSLVAFPPAFDVVTVDAGEAAIETVDLGCMPVDQDIINLYRRECAMAGIGEDAALSAETYGEFLRRHTQALVSHRYFRREWPEQVVSVIAAMTVADLLSDPRTCPPTADGDVDADRQREGVGLSGNALRNLSVVELVADWYCLRQGGPVALACLGQERLDLLRRIAAQYGESAQGEDARVVGRYLATFFRSLLFYIDRAARPPQRHALR